MPIALSVLIVFIVPIAVTMVMRVRDKSLGSSSASDFDRLFKQEAKVLSGYVDQKLVEVRDNAIDLDIAVKKANHLSKTLESEMSKISPKIESYKDYEAAIFKYQDQVNSLEDAYLEIMNKVDSILKERHNIDKTYKRLSDVKGKIVDVENNVASMQGRVIDAYNQKFEDFEGQLYERFDKLTENIAIRDKNYNEIANQERAKINQIVADFREQVAEKEKMFDEHLSSLTERVSKENIENITDMFENARNELVGQYRDFADDLNAQSKELEARFESVSMSKEEFENELFSIKNSIHEKLSSITEDSISSFKEEMDKTKNSLLAAMMEDIEKIAHDRDDVLAGLDEKANTINDSIESMKESSVSLEESYAERTQEIADSFNAIKEGMKATTESLEQSLAEKEEELKAHFDNAKEEVSLSLRNDVEALAGSLRETLENEEDGIVTLYKQKTKEFEDINNELSSVAEQTRVNFNDKISEIEKEIENFRTTLTNSNQVELDKALEDATNTVTKHLNMFENSVVEKNEAISEEYKKRIGEFATYIEYVKDQLEEINTSINDDYPSFKQRVQALDAEFNDMFEVIKEREGGMNEKLEKIDSYFENIEAYAEDRVAEIDEAAATAQTNIADAEEKSVASVEDDAVVVKDRMQLLFNDIEEKRTEVAELIDFKVADFDKLGDEAKEYVTERTNEFDETINSNLNNFKNKVDDSLSSVENRADEVLNTINDHAHVVESELDNHNKNITEKTSEYLDWVETNKLEIEQYFNSQKNIFDNMGEEFFVKLEKDVFEKITELRALVDDSINRYQEEISEIESVRAESVSDVLAQYRGMALDIKKEHEDLLAALNADYNNKMDVMNKVSDEVKEECQSLEESSKANYEETYQKILDATAALGEEQIQSKKYIDELFNGLVKRIDDDILNLSLENKNMLNDIAEELRSTNQADVEELLSSLKRDFADIVGSLEDKRSEHEGRIGEIESEYDDILANIRDKEAILDELTKEKNNYSEDLKSFVDSMKSDLENFEESAVSKDELLKSLAELETRFNEICENQKEHTQNIYDQFEEDKGKILENIENVRDEISNDIMNIEVDTSDVKKEILNDLAEQNALAMAENREAIEGDIKSKLDNFATEYNLEKLNANMENPLSENMNALIESTRNSLDTQLVNVKRTLEDLDGRVENIEYNRIFRLSEDLNEAKNNLNQKVKENQDSIEDILKEIASLIKSRDYFNGEIEELKRDKEELYNRHDAGESNLKYSIEDLEQKIVEMTNSAKSYIEEKEKAIDDAIAGFENNISGKDELAKLIESVEADRAVQGELSQRVDDLNNTLSSDKEYYEARFNDVDDKLVESLSAMREDFSFITDKLEEVENGYAQQLAKSESLENEISSNIVPKLYSIENALENLKGEYNDHLDNIVESLQNDLSSFDSRMVDLENAIKEDVDIDDALAGVREDSSSVLSRLEDLENRLNSSIDELAESNENIHSEFEKTRADISELSQNMPQDTSALKDEIMSELNLDEKMSALKDEVLSDINLDEKLDNALDNTRKMLDSGLNDVNERMSALKDDVATDINNAQENTREMLDNGLNDVNERMSALKDDIASELDEKLDSVQHNAQEILEEGINNIDERVSSLRDEILAEIGLDEKLGNVDQNVRDILDSGLEGIAEQVSLLEASLEGITNDKVPTLEDRISGVDESVKTTTDDLKEKIAALAYEVREIVSAKEQMTSDIEALVNSRDELVERLNDENNDEDDNNEIAENIAKVEEELRTLISDTRNYFDDKVGMLEGNMDILEGEFNNKLQATEHLMNEITEAEQEKARAYVDGQIEKEKDSILESMENIREEIANDISNIEIDTAELKREIMNELMAQHTSFEDDVRARVDNLVSEYNLETLNANFDSGLNDNINQLIENAKNALENQIGSIKRSLEDVDSRIENIEYNRMFRLSEDLNEVKNNLSQKVREHQDSIDDLVKEISTLVKSKDYFEAEIDELKKEKDELVEMANLGETNLADSILDIEQKIEEMTGSAQNYIEEKEQSIADTIAEFENNAVDREEFAKLLEAIEADRAEASELSENVGALEQKVEDLTGSVATDKEYYEGRFNDADEKLAESLSAIREDFSFISGKIEELQNNYADQLAKTQGLEDELNSNIVPKLYSVEEALDNIKTEYSENIDNIVENLQNELASFDTKMVELDNAIKNNSNIDEALESVREQSSAYLSRLEDLENRLTGSIDELVESSQNITNDLEKTKADLNDLSDSIEEDARALKEEIMSEINLDERLDNVSENTKELLDNGLSGLSEKISALEASVEYITSDKVPSLSDRIDSIDTDVKAAHDELKDRVTSLIDEVGEIVSAKEKMASDIDELVNSRQELLEQSTNGHENNSEDLAKVEADLRTLIGDSRSYFEDKLGILEGEFNNRLQATENHYDALLAEQQSVKEYAEEMFNSLVKRLEDDIVNVSLDNKKTLDSLTDEFRDTNKEELDKLLESMKKDFTDIVESLEDKKAEHENKIGDIEKEYNDIVSDLKSKDEQYQELVNQEKTDYTEDLKSFADSMKEDIANMEQSFVNKDELLEKLSDLEERFNDICEEQKQYSQSISDSFEEEKGKMLDNIESLREELSNDISNIEADTNNIKNEILDEVADKSASLEAEQGRIADSIESLREEVSNDISNIELDTDGIKNEILDEVAAKNASFEEEIKNKIDSFVSEYNLENMNANFDNGVSEDVNTLIENIKNSLETQLGNVKRTLEDVDGRIENIEYNRIFRLSEDLNEVKNNLGQKIKENQDAIAEIVQEMKTLVKSKDYFTTEIEELKKEKDDLLAKYNNGDTNLKDSILDLEQKIEEMTSSAQNYIEQKEQSISDTIAEFEKNVLAKDEFSKLAEELSAKYDSLASSLDNNSAEQGRLSSKLDELQSTFENHQNIVSELEQKIEEVNASLSSDKDYYESRLNDVDDRLIDSISSLEDSISSLTYKLEELEGSYSDQLEQASEFANEINSNMLPRLDSLENALAETKSECNASIDNVLENLHNDLATFDNRMLELENGMKDGSLIDDVLSSLKEESASSVLRLDELENKLNNSIDELVESNENINIEFEKTKADFNELADSIEQDAKSLKQEIMSELNLDEKLDGLNKNAKETLENSLNNLETKVSLLEQSLEDIRNDKVLPLSDKINDVDSSVKALEDELREKVDSVADSVKEITGAKEKIISDIEELIKSRDELVSRVDDKSSDNTLASNISEVQEQLKNLIAESRTYFESKIGELECGIGSLESGLNDKIQANEALYNELSQAEQEKSKAYVDEQLEKERAKILENIEAIREEVSNDISNIEVDTSDVKKEIMEDLEKQNASFLEQSQNAFEFELKDKLDNLVSEYQLEKLSANFENSLSEDTNQLIENTKNALETQIANLKRALEDVDGRIENIEYNRIFRLSEDLNEAKNNLNTKLKEHQDSIDNVVEEIKQLQKDKDAIVEKYNAGETNLADSIKDIDQKIEDMTSSAQNYIEEKEQSIANIIAEFEQNVLSSGEFAKFVEDVESDRVSQKELEQKVEDLNTTVTNDKEYYENRMNDLDEKLSDGFATLEENLSEVSQKLEELESNYSTQLLTASEFVNEISSNMIPKVDSLEKALEETREICNGYIDNVVDNLQNDLAAFDNRMAQIEGGMRDGSLVDNVLSSLKDEITVTASRLKDLENRVNGSVDELIANNEAVHNELEKAREEFNELSDSLEQDVKLLKADILDELDLDEKLGSVGDEAKTTLERGLGSLSEKIASLENALKDIEDEKLQLLSDRINDVDTNVKAFSDKVNSLVDNVKDLNDEKVSSLSDRINNIDTNVLEFGEKVGSVIDSIKDINQAKEQMSSNIEKLLQSRDELLSRVNDDAANEEVVSNISKVENEIRTLISENRDYFENKIGELENNIEVLEDEFNNKIQSTEDQYRELSAEHESSKEYAEEMFNSLVKRFEDDIANVSLENKEILNSLSDDVRDSNKAELELLIASIKKDFADIVSGLEEKRAEHTSKIGDIEKEYNAIISDIKDKEEKYEVLVAQEKTSYTDELKSFSDSVKDSIANLEQSIINKDELLEKLIELENKFDDICLEQKEYSDTIFNQFEEDKAKILDNIEHVREEISNDVSNLEVDTDALKKEVISEIVEQNTSFETEIQNKLEKFASEYNFEKLNASLETGISENMNALIENAKSSLETQIGNVKRSLEDVDKRIENIEYNRIFRLSEDLNEAKTSLNQKLKENQDSIENIVKEMATLIKSSDYFTTEIDNLKQEKEELFAKYNAGETNLADSIKEIEQKIEEMTSSAQSYIEEKEQSIADSIAEFEQNVLNKDEFEKLSETLSAKYQEMADGVEKDRALQNGLNESIAALDEKLEQKIEDLNNAMLSDKEYYEGRLNDTDDKLEDSLSGIRENFAFITDKLEEFENNYSAHIENASNFENDMNSNILPKLYSLENALEESREQYNSQIDNIVENIQNDLSHFDTRMLELESAIKDGGEVVEALATVRGESTSALSRIDELEARLNSSIDEMLENNDNMNLELEKAKSDFNDLSDSVEQDIKLIKADILGELELDEKLDNITNSTNTALDNISRDAKTALDNGLSNMSEKISSLEALLKNIENEKVSLLSSRIENVDSNVKSFEDEMKEKLALLKDDLKEMASVREKMASDIDYLLKSREEILKRVDDSSKDGDISAVETQIRGLIEDNRSYFEHKVTQLDSGLKELDANFGEKIASVKGLYDELRLEQKSAKEHTEEMFASLIKRLDNELSTIGAENKNLADSLGSTNEELKNADVLNSANKEKLEQLSSVLDSLKENVSTIEESSMINKDELLDKLVELETKFNDTCEQQAQYSKTLAEQIEEDKSRMLDNIQAMREEISSDILNIEVDTDGVKEEIMDELAEKNASFIEERQAAFEDNMKAKLGEFVSEYNLDKLNANLENTENEGVHALIENAKNTLETQIANIKKSLEDVDARIENIEYERLFKLSNNLEEAKKNLEDRLQKHDEGLEHLADEINQLHEDKDEIFEKYNAGETNIKDGIDAIEKKVEDIYAKLSIDRENFDKQLADNKENFDKQLADNKENFDKQLADSKENFDKQLADNKEHYDQQFADNEERLAGSFSSIEDNFSIITSKLEEIENNYASQLEHAENFINDINSNMLPKVYSLEEAIDETKEEYNAYIDKVIEHLQGDLAAFDERVVELEKGLKDGQTVTDIVPNVQEQALLALSRLDELENKLNNSVQDLLASNESVSGQFEKARADFYELASNMEQENASLKGDILSEINLDAQLEGVNNNAKELLDSGLNELAEKISILEASLEEVREDKVLSLSDKIDDVDSNVKSFEDEMRDKISLITDDIDDITSAKERMASEIEEILRNRADVSNNVEVKNNDEISANSMETVNNEIRRVVSDTRSYLENKINNLEDSMKVFEGGINNRIQTTENLYQEMATENKNSKEYVEDMFNSLLKRLDDDIMNVSLENKSILGNFNEELLDSSRQKLEDLQMSMDEIKLNISKYETSFVNKDELLEKLSELETKFADISAQQGENSKVLSKQFDEYKGRVLEDIEKVRDEILNDVSNLESDVQDVKSSLSADLEKSQATLEEDMKSKLDNLVLEYNLPQLNERMEDSINARVSDDTKTLIDSAKNALELQIGGVKKSLEDMDSRIENIEYNRIFKLSEELNEAKKALEEKLQEQHDSISGIGENISGVEDKVFGIMEEIKLLREEKDAILEKYNSGETGLKDNIDAIEQKIEDLDARLSSDKEYYEARLNDSDEKLSDSISSISAIAEKLEELENIYNTKVEQADNFINDINANMLPKVDILESALEETKSKYDEYIDNIVENFQNDLSAFDSRVAELEDVTKDGAMVKEEVLSSAMARLDELEDRLNSSVQELLENNESINREFEKSKAEFDNLSNSLGEETLALKENILSEISSTPEIDSSISNLSEKISQLESALEDVQDGKVSALSDRIDEIDNNVKTFEEGVRELIDSSRSHIEDKINDLEVELSNNIATVNSLCNELSSGQEKILSVVDELDNTILSKINQMKEGGLLSDFSVEELNKMREEVASMLEGVKEHSRVYDDAIIEHSDKITSIITTLENKTEEENKAIENAIANEREYYLKEIQTVVDRYKDLYEKTENLEGINGDDVNQLKETIEAIENSLKGSVENLDTRIDEVYNTLEEEKATSNEKLESIRSEMLEGLSHKLDASETLNEDVKLDFDSIKANITEHVKSIVDAMIDEVGINEKVDAAVLNYDSLKDELAVENKAFREKVDTAVSNYDSLKDELAVENEVLREKVDTAVSNYDSLKDELAVENEALREKVDTAVSNYDSLKNELAVENEALREKVDTAVSNYDSLKNELAVENEVLREKVDTVAAQYDSLKDDFKTEKDLDREIISEEVKKIGDETMKSFEKISESLDEKIYDIYNNINKDQNDKFDELLVNISDNKRELSDFATELQKQINSAKEDMLNIEKSMNQKIDDSATALQKNIDALYERMSNISTDVESSIVQKEKTLLEKIDAIGVEVNSTLGVEISNLKPEILKMIDGYVADKTDFAGRIEIIENNIKNIEGNFLEELERSISVAQEKVELNLDIIEKKFSIHEEDLLIRFKEEFDSYSDKSLTSTKELFSKIEDEYETKISSLNGVLEAMRTSLETSMNEAREELSTTFNLKDDFIFSMKDNQKQLEDFEANLKNLEASFEPTISKIEATLDDRVNDVYERIDDTNARLLKKEDEFKQRLDFLVNDFTDIRNTKTDEVEAMLTNAREAEKQLVDSVNEKVSMILEEKSNSLDSLRSNYEEMFENLEIIKNELTESINNKIDEANLIVDEKTSVIAASFEARCKESMESVSNNLNETINELIEEARTSVEKARDTLHKEQADKLGEFKYESDNIRDLIDNLSKDLARENSEHDVRLDQLSKVFDEKETALLERFKLAAEDMQATVKTITDSFDNTISEKELDVSTSYESLKDLHDSLEAKVQEYLAQFENIKQCDELTEAVANNIKTLNDIITETNEKKESLEATVNEFDKLKSMQNDIINYTAELEKEREMMKETEQYMEVITALHKDVSDKVAGVLVEKENISSVEEAVIRVLDFADQLEGKLHEINDRDTNLTMILTRIASSETETEEVEKRVVEIKASLISLDENRERLIEKIRKIESDTALLTKNDKKIQTLISKLEQFDLMIEELSNQREKMVRATHLYAEQEYKVEDNLKRADEAIQVLNNLLTDADKYIFDDGTSLATEEQPSKKLKRPKKGAKVESDQYVGVDSKKTKLVIDLYNAGWSYENIVRHTSFKQEEVETIISRWKEKQSRM